MPNTLFHASFAYKLGKELSCFTDDRSLNLYLLGSYGPDIFFYDRLPPTPFIPNQKHHGNLLHAASSDIIACSLLKHADPSLISYVYGFLTHIALDSTLHPYVCSRTTGMDHTRFEGDIDSVTRDTVNQTCPGAYKRSLKKLIRLYKIMYDPEAKRLHMINTFEKLFHKEGIISGFLTGPGHNFFDDCMNEKHMSWAPKFFPDEKRTESVDELTMEAETLAINLINAAKRNDLASIIALCSERNMQDGPLPR